MMVAMTTYNPLAISLFTASWTAGMAAMMFPAIAPMVLLYNRFVANSNKEGKEVNQSALIVQEEEGEKPRSSSSIHSLRVILFIGCYLLVWALTGIALLLGWSLVMNNTIMMTTTASAGNNSQLIASIYGVLLIIAGAYQFTPLKRVCIGYCESPLSFFMRRWKDGTSGAVRMGLWHGLYCLGCCWPYFLLMVALGWMNLLWMGLFAGIIFAEKMWSRGIWVARTAGIGLVITGILVISGMLPSLVLSSAASLMSGESGSGGSSDGMVMDNGGIGAMSGVEGTSSMTNDNSSEGSMQMQNPVNNMGNNSEAVVSSPVNSDAMSEMKMPSSASK
ncbi:DUF2182 domain-containing protein [Candidatus Nitrososphaera evergladensis]|nr:DUF2182 domain-containing protein [Candidatus Nitrososphaera evergladensis]